MFGWAGSTDAMTAHHDRFALKPLVLAMLSALPLMAQAQANRPAVPPNALPVPAPIGWRVNGSGGNWAPAIGAQGSHAVINQISQRAIYNWQSFNIGESSSLTYQFGKADGSALNRVTGSVAPSQIFGRLSSTVPGADGKPVTGGTVLLINPNGILFGPKSQVNTGALIASTLNVSDSDYLAGFDPTLRSEAPTFVYDGGPELFFDGRSSNFVRVDPGAVIETPSGGRVFLFAKNVDNAGTIRTPGGQTVLAAGGEVWLNDPSNEKLYASEVNSEIPGLRGLLVEVGGVEGIVRNTGTIEVPRGNATLVAMAVNQSGRISATTSVAENGSVFLLARGTVQSTNESSLLKRATRGGVLTLGEGSRIEISPDTTRDAKGGVLTADSAATFTTSRVELSGQSIELQKDAAIVAPGGIVNARAEARPSYNPLDIARGDFGELDDAARLTLGAGVRIDVAGTTTSEVSAGRNFVTTELLGANDLKDAPLQRDGPLYRSRVTFDLRKSVPILGDTSSYANAIQRSAEERLARGGSVMLAAAGLVMTDQSSQLDVSGGRVSYNDAQVRPSTLVGEDGARYSLNNAPADIRYSAIEGNQPAQLDRWGRVVPFLPARERLEMGYVEGRDAGMLAIHTPIALIAGRVNAGATIGERQRAGLDPVAKNGAIELGTRIAGSNPFGTGNPASGVLRDFSITAAPRALPEDLFNPGALGPLPAGGWVGAATLNDSGAGSVRVTSYGNVVVEEGAALQLPRRGSLELNAAGAQGITLGADITAQGGSVLVQTVDAPRGAGGITLRAGRRIDVAGDWINQSLDGTAAGSAVAGGSVELLSAHGLDLQNGSTIDVSGGATVSTGGALSGSNAGSIKLESDRGSTVAAGEVGPSPVHIGADLRGMSMAGGGSLRLRAAEIDVRDNARFGPRPPIRDGASVGSLVIDDDFFSLGGFASFDIEGAHRLGVDPSTQIAPQASRWVATSQSRFASSGTRPADTLTASLLPEGQRNAASLRLASNGLAQGRPSGDLTLGRGASIKTDAGAAVTLSAASQLTVDAASRITAPGGKVTLELSRNPAFSEPFVYPTHLQIRDGAQIDVSGKTVLQPSPDDQRIGRVFDGGVISLAVNGAVASAPRTAAIDIAAGAVLRADGAADTLDISTRSNAGMQVTRTAVTSAGGRIEIDANDGGARIAGTLSARSGGATASDGSLALRFPWLRPSADVNPLLHEYLIEVGNAPVGAPPPRLGVASISAKTIRDGHFADVTLRALDRIHFLDSVALEAGRSIKLEAPVLSAAAGANLLISAPGSVMLGAPVASPVPAAPPLSSNTATLRVEGGLVGWSGTQELRNFAKVEVDAASRLQFDAVGINNEAKGKGVLRTDADLVLRAGQTAVTTLTDFVIDAPGRSVTFTGGDAAAAPLLSAGGALNVNAARIVQDGVVRAPFGQIAFNASESVSLRPGSVTSVSGTGLGVPFGSTLGGTDWSFNAGLVAALPVKAISLNAPGQAVNVEAGAQLGLAGGGSLFAPEFVPGPGGSKDVFSGAIDGSFAIVPGIVDHAPADADIARLAAAAGVVLPSLGQQITLGAGGTLAAGTYAVLPARYALLPGAFLVTPAPGKIAVDPSYSVTRPDGAQVLAGQRGSAGTGYLDGVPSAFIVRTSEQARLFSEVRTANADAYFSGRAGSQDSAVPRLTQDAGSLRVEATRMLLAGAIDFSRSSTPLAGRAARGGEIDIAADRIVVTDSGAAAAAAAAPGTLVLTAAQINDTGAASILLGGTRSASASGAREIDVSAREVIIGNAVEALAVADLIVAATDSVRLDPKANLAASADAAGSDALTTQGDGALLRASSDIDASVTRTGVLRDAGRIDIGAGAKIAAGGLIIESTAGTRIAADAALQARAVTLGAPRIALGNTTSTPGAVPPGADSLVVGPALSASLAAAESLSLRSFSSIDLYGSITVGGVNQRALTLDSAAISVLGQAAHARAEAGDVRLVNTSGAVAAATSGSGRLTLHAHGANGGDGDLRLGPGAVALQGVADARIVAQRSLVFEDTGQLSAGGKLVMAAGSVSADQAATAGVSSAGLLRIESVANAAAAPAGGAGASLTLRGSRVEQAGRIDLASGRLDLIATGNGDAGGIEFSAGSKTLLGGRSTSFDGVEVTTRGGDLHAETRAGNVVVATAGAGGAAALIDVSAGGALAHAGSMRFAATGGAVQIGGTLHARSADALGGSLAIDSRDPVDLTDLARTLAQGADTGHANFAASIAARNRIGDQVLAAGSTLKARAIELAADGGGVTIAGTLNASGPSGGMVSVAARDDITLVSEAHVIARGEAQGAAGGGLRLSTRDRTIALNAGAKVDTSGGAGGRDGHVGLRAPRVGAAAASASGTEVQVGPIAASFTGADRIDVEAVKVYADRSSVDSTLMATIASHNSAFAGTKGAQAHTILTRLAGGNAALRDRLHLRSGVEVRSSSSSDMSLASDWNLTPFDTSGNPNRPGGEPMNLTLRAAGDLKIQASLSDGFRATSGTASRIIPEATIVAGSGASLRLVGGADLQAAAPNATLASETRGDVIIGKAGTPVIVRTTDGAIEIAAGRDVKLLNRQAVVYTTGVPTAVADLPGWVRPVSPGSQYTIVSGSIPQSPMLDGGGAVTVRAERDVQGGTDGKTQYGREWWWRGDSGGETDVISWWSRYDKFKQGFGALGGGDVQVRAGRDARDVQLAAGSSGYIVPGVDGAAPQVSVHDAGSATLVAGRDVAGGFVFATGPHIDVRAGNKLALGTPTAGSNESSLQVLHGNTRVDLDARADATVGRVGAAGLMPAMSNQYPGSSSTYSFYLGGLTADAGLRAVATSGALHYRAEPPQASAVEGAVPAGPATQVIPAHTLLAAPEGSAAVSVSQFSAGVNQTPAERAELAIVSRDSLEAGAVLVNGVTASALIPGRHETRDVNSDTGRPFMLGRTPLQADGAGPVRLVATEGDVTLKGQVEVAAPLRIVATRDIVAKTGLIQMQHQADAALSLFDAGRDLQLATDVSAGVIVHGPGDLIVRAGRNIDFSTSLGFSAKGSRDNTALPAGSATLTLAGGVAAGDWQSAQTAYFHLLGATGVAGRAGELVAQLDAVAAGQTSPTLGSTTAKTFDALPVAQQLDAVRQRVGEAAFDAALLALMRRQAGDPALLLADAQTRFATQPDGVKQSLVGSALTAAWSAGVPPQARAGLAVALAEQASAAGETSYTKALRDYVERRTGTPAKSLADAVERFATLPPEAQLVFTNQVLGTEVRNAGRAAAVLAGDEREQAYAKAYSAIDTVFPTLGTSGDLLMGVSQIKTLQDSDIVLLAPRGGINVGELIGSTSKKASDLGVVTSAGGGVSMIVRDDVDVNQSRVFTVGKGDLLIWAGQGNIDAGRGAKTVTGAPPPIYRVKDGRVEVDTSGSFSGSGIAVLNADSTLDLYAPKGEINAGDAGIKSLGNAFLGASRFVGADNLAISGVAVGAPPAAPAAAATAGLAALGQSATAATRIDPDDSEEEKQRKRRKRLSLIIDFLGFGEGPAKP